MGCRYAGEIQLYQYFDTMERRGSDDRGRLSQDARTNRGEREVSISCTSTHAAACVRLQAGERRAGHARGAALSRSQEYSAHRALHRTVAGAVQVVLGRLMSAY